MAVKRGGLGKGLDSMIPMSDSGAIRKKKTAQTSVQDAVKGEKIVDITQIQEGTVQFIKLSNVQPRKQFNEDALLELAESIKQFGVLQPLLVQKKEDYYEIIAGERRWRASKLAGIKEIPVIVKEFSSQEAVEISLIENIQREDLNPIEEAVAYKRLMDEFHLKQDTIAERVSKSRTAVTNSMRLLKLDDRVQQMLIDEMITTGHARTLLALDNKNMQLEVAAKVFDEKLSVRETERLVKELLNPAPKKPEKEIDEAQDLIYKNLEEKIKQIIGSKVAINRKSKDKGRIEIEYYSQEELERIVELLETIR